MPSHLTLGTSYHHAGVNLGKGVVLLPLPFAPCMVLACPVSHCLSRVKEYLLNKIQDLEFVLSLPCG